MFSRTLVLAVVFVFATATAASAFDVTFGTSWDGADKSLQTILDELVGPGVLDAATDYEGYLAGDADPPYWFDNVAEAILVREIAGNRDTNELGWYLETETVAPAIDGVDDAVIFTGPASPGNAVLISFGAPTKFGLYLAPNGDGDATNAPDPELFFTNRAYNDLGADGSGAIHAPFDGDVQALIYNITSLRNGIQTYIVAFEDLDSGSPITPAYTAESTDNDFNDLVIEISADSPVPTADQSWGAVKSLYRN